MTLEKVNTIMSRDVITLGPQEPLRTSIEKMSFHNVSCVFVLKNRKAVGILTERDIIHLIGGGVDLNKANLESVMRSPVIAISEQTDISEAANIMTINNVRRLAIVDDLYNIIGIVTQTDIIKNLNYESFIGSKKIEQIMQRRIISVEKKDLLFTAIELMIKNNISCILIIENSKPVGIITEHDITKAVAENAVSDNVDKIMSAPVLTVHKDMNLYDATRLMDEKKLSRLVIINAEGAVIGIITKSDIVRNLRADYIELLKNILKEKSQALVESEIKYRTLVEQSLEGIVIVQGGLIKFANIKLLKILNYKEEEVTDKDILRFLYPDDRKLLLENFKQLSDSLPVEFPVEIRMLHSNGEAIYMEGLSTLIQYEGNAAVLITLRDITERKKTEAELKRLVITDDLTGLYNQRFFYIQITKEIERAKRHRRPLSMLLIDIDLFKDFNDMYGHWEGDFVLKKVGEILMKSVRDIDMAFRYGGEEFTVILPETNHKEAIIIAERIRKTVAQTVFYPFTLDGKPEITTKTVSIGVTEFCAEDSVKSFLKRADNAMYKAKSKGRNAVVYLLLEKDMV